MLASDVWIEKLAILSHEDAICSVDSLSSEDVAVTRRECARFGVSHTCAGSLCIFGCFMSFQWFFSVYLTVIMCSCA